MGSLKFEDAMKKAIEQLISENSTMEERVKGMYNKIIHSCNEENKNDADSNGVTNTMSHSDVTETP